MGQTNGADRRLAVRGAFAGAILFVVLIVAFSTMGPTQPTRIALLVIGFVGAASHLVLLPVVAVMPAPPWVRACGYAWLLLDVVLNVATINGADQAAIAALRLGGHVPGGVWIAVAAQGAGGAVRTLGVPLGIVLVAYSFIAPQVPAWVLFIPFVLIPVWLTIVGRQLQGSVGPALAPTAA